MNKSNKKKIIPVIIAAVVVLAVICGVFIYNSGLAPTDKNNKDDVIVTVEQGSSAYEILDALADKGLVKSKLSAKLYMKLNSPDNLQAYTYVLNKSMSFKEILGIIEAGDLKYVMTSKFTIIEGSTAADAAKNIAKELSVTEDELKSTWNDEAYLKKLIKKYWFLTDDILNQDLICPLEGFLYPDTYFIIKENPTTKDITEQILDNTEAKLGTIKDEMEKYDGSLFELMTLSSIVENESLYEEDRPKIAGVFVNRLAKDMPLQSDITVLYPLGEKRVDVRESDLQVDSKYNTYKHAGLPVGPVCSPAVDTIKDTINYDKNDYLYFFATEDGKVLYSKTYEEHLKNIEENGWY